MCIVNLDHYNAGRSAAIGNLASCQITYSGHLPLFIVLAVMLRMVQQSLYATFRPLSLYEMQQIWHI